MEEKKFIYFRRNSADEGIPNVVPSRFTHKEILPQLAANVRSVDLALKRLHKGLKVRTRNGIFWAEEVAD